MKESFEIILCQKRKHAVPCKRLGGPKKKWGKGCSNDDDRDKIDRQFSYVFQAR